MTPRFVDRHPRWSFLAAQVVAWGAFYSVQYFALLPRLEARERLPFLVVEGTMWITGVTLTSLMAPWYAWISRTNVPGRFAGRAALVLATIWLAAETWVLIDGAVFGAFVRWTAVRFDWPRITSLMRGSYWLTLFAWSGGLFAFRAWESARLRERALLELEVQHREAQLRALAWQLNPHFLFNTLNSVRALVLESPHDARAMITRLASFLRFTLRIPTRAENTVGAEVDALRSYLAIEEVRFEELLVVKWEMDEEALGCIVPSLILQPLVENAIRYGARDANGRQTITIGARLDGDALSLSVVNAGALSGRGDGIGLENVRARLMHAYPGRHAVHLTSVGGQVLVELRIERPQGRVTGSNMKPGRIQPPFPGPS